MLTKAWKHVLPLRQIGARFSSHDEITSSMPEFPGISHDELYSHSVENPDEFWGTLGRSRLQWDQDFHTTSDCDLSQAKINWFVGGSLNASVQCLDRHLPSRANQTALIWEGDEPEQVETITYQELHTLTCKIANVLKKYNVKKGDRVVLYLPACIIAAAAMHACNRIGAVHAVVFAGFSPQALASRIKDAGAETVITMDAFYRGGAKVPLKKLVQAAINSPDGASVKTVLMTSRINDGDHPSTDMDVDLDAEVRSSISLALTPWRCY
jgi:acetyl-CoA synthetase